MNETTTALISDPTLSFFIVLVIILAAPLLRRLRVPHIIGLMMAGVLIGPHALNLIARDRSFEIFGQVGIYYIMFLAALEMDMGSVSQYGRRGLQFGLLTFLIPCVLGLASAHHLLNYGLATSLMLGCIYGSHTLVTYPIVSRYGLGRNQSVVTSVVATAFSIFLALLLVTIMTGTMRPDADWRFWIWFVIKCAAYATFVIMVYPRFGRWFLRRYDDSVVQYIFVMALLFLSASLAEFAGLEGLLGAFLAGLVVNRLIPRTSPLMNRIEFMGNALFIPYFLIGVGMIIDVQIMVSDVRTIWIVAVMVVTATFGKWLAAEAMRFLQRTNRYSRMLMFGLTNSHAAGALAIVMIGTDPQVNLMDNSVLNGTVMLILFSCIISSLATNYGARHTALRETQLEENRGSFHGKCLVAYSQEDNVAAMTQMAMLIRNPYITAGLIGLTVSYDDEDGQRSRSKARRMLDKAQAMATASDVDMITMNRISTNIAGGILHTMVEHDCGEVIVSLADRDTDQPKSKLGAVIDNILEGSYREVMALHSIVALGTLRRVVVAVPQKAEYEVGFYKWLEHVSRIGEQLGCRMHFHANSETLPYIRSYMKEKHGSLRNEFHHIEHWQQLVGLASQMGEDDMLAVVSSRRGFISHRSILDRLPIIINRYFGHTSVLLIYPDQQGDPSETGSSIFAPNGLAVTRQDRLRRLFN